MRRIYNALYVVLRGSLKKALIACLAILVKLESTTKTVTAVIFSDKLNQVLRAFMTYGQGREMVKHAETTQRTGTTFYLADPHCPWLRSFNENTKDLLRQYFPKGTGLSVYSQEEALNARPPLEA